MDGCGRPGEKDGSGLLALDGQDEIRTPLDMIIAVAEGEPAFGAGLHIGQELALEIVGEEGDRPVIKPEILDIPCVVQEEARNSRVVPRMNALFRTSADAGEEVLVHQEGCRLAMVVVDSRLLEKSSKLLFETSRDVERKPDTLDGRGCRLLSGSADAGVYSTPGIKRVFDHSGHDTAIGVDDVAAADDLHAGGSGSTSGCRRRWLDVSVTWTSMGSGKFRTRMSERAF